MSRRRKFSNNDDLLGALFATAASEAKARRTNDTWVQKAEHIRTLLMPKQALLEKDRSRRKSVRSPRQTGKSTGTMLIVAIRCLERAGSEWVVIGLTRASVKRAYWGALKALNDAYDLGIEFQNQELTATFKNGSSIQFVGGETIADVEKLRGGRYAGVVIDEAKSYGHKMFEEMVYDILEAALLANNGELIIIGTPGDILAGPFYRATCEEPILEKRPDGSEWYSNWPYQSPCPGDHQWSLHQWTLQDNITVFEDKDGRKFTLWDEALELKRKNGWDDNNATWRREYLGHWVADDFKRVYRYFPHIHDYEPDPTTRWGLPNNLDKKGWRAVIGFDFGTRDGTALVVWAYHPHEKGLWELYSEVKSVKKQKGVAQEEVERLSVSMIADWYHEVEAEFGPFDGWPADMAGLATMVIDTLADEHQVYLEAAEKKEKNDHIELFNNDLDAKVIHIRKGSILSDQLLEDRWDLKKMEKGKKVEDDSISNDAADAALYSFRWSNHRRAKDKPPPPKPFGSTAWWVAQEDQEIAEARRKARERIESQGQLDAPWWNG